MSANKYIIGNILNDTKEKLCGLQGPVFFSVGNDSVIPDFVYLRKQKINLNSKTL